MTDNNRQPKSNPKTPQDKIGGMGKGMIIIAWILAIGLATWMFADIEEQQNNPNRSPSSLTGDGEIRVELLRNRYGHYVTNGKVDGQDVIFMLDTGATNIAIPGALEKYLNLTRGRGYQVNTANGTAVAYATNIDHIQIGEIKLHNVRASINPSMQGQHILLGMTALKQLELRQKGETLTLIQDLR